MTEAPDTVKIVWWRMPSEDSAVPPLAAIAWASTNDLEHGVVHVSPDGAGALPDEEVVAARVTDSVQGRVQLQPGSRIVVEPVGDRLEEFLPLRRLAETGVDVRTVDFGVTGLDVVGGITAELDASGIVTAIVLVRDGLIPVHARRVVAWAEAEISATREDPYGYDWHEAGWRRTTGHRWQILVRS